MHLSIIVPVYNSESFVKKTLDEIDAFLVGLDKKCELIVVDDGSMDSTASLAEGWALKERSYPVRVIRLEKNLGKGAGVAAGVLAAKGKYRIFLDADLAYPPSQILKILEALEEGNDVAVACRVHKDSRYTISPASFHYLYTRHLASRIVNFFMRHTIIPDCSDSQAGLKGFTAAAAEAIFSQQIVKGFPFDVEAMYLAEKMKLKIKEVAVEYRYFNEPTTVVFMQDGFSMARDVARVHMHNLRGRYRLCNKDAKKNLIINADDFGMTLAISRGILKTVESGVVCGTSAVSNSPDFKSSMDELAAAKAKPDIGFHATLTWGSPLSDPQIISSLVDKEGRFLSREKLLLKSLLGKISEEEAYIELRAQCEQLSKRCPEISHMDGHHHVHVFPIVRKAAERVAREFGIKFVRAPYEGIWSPHYSSLARRLPIAVLAASKPGYWQKRGFETTGHFGGFALGACKDLTSRWQKTVESLPYGATEIMVHPGYFSDNKDGYNAEREDEVKVLCDELLKKKISETGVNLISFKEMSYTRRRK